jgi:hypothetical protein
MHGNGWAMRAGMRVVLQKISEKHNGCATSYFLRLGRHSKQARDERNLACDVSFVYPLHLPFPHDVHHLIALERPPRCLEGKEAHTKFDEPFDEAVILLHDVVEVLHSPQFTVLRKIPLCFQLLEGFWIGCVFVHRDHPRRYSMRCGKHFAEKVFGRLGIACRTQAARSGELSSPSGCLLSLGHTDRADPGGDRMRHAMSPKGLDF